MNPDEVRQKILENGWKQGSIIDYKVMRHNACQLEMPEAFPEMQEEAYIVVISMSCDVVYGDESVLPDIECLICLKEVTRKKITNTKSNDPRKMVLAYGVEQKLVFKMKNRLFIPRKLFLETTPEDTLSQEKINSIVRWKISQYNRLGLPESLVDRIGYCLRDKDFENWVARNSELLEGIFIELPIFDELDTNEKYELGIIAVANREKVNNEQVYDLVEGFEGVLIDKLKLIDSISLLNDQYEQEDQGIDSVISSDEFTYDLLKRFRKYHLDQYSLDPTENNNPISL